MKKFKIKRTKGMSCKNYIKEEYDVICYECRIKVSYFVNCSDKLSRKVMLQNVFPLSSTPHTDKVLSQFPPPSIQGPTQPFFPVFSYSWSPTSLCL